MNVISRVKPHQHLTSLYLLADVNQALNNFALNTKAQIALYPRDDSPGELVRVGARIFDLGGLNDTIGNARVGVSLSFAADES
ncbi:hypothetical protein [Gluconobacter sp. Dm-74]|uniref:hypothetical protein n=1 Tax=Gluconobacter sp. Dm-74 TaxID=2799803 RepID=UPI002012F71D|nr:hypothetical protein [Gluconobacter sp. Dm-74]